MPPVSPHTLDAITAISGVISTLQTAKAGVASLHASLSAAGAGRTAIAAGAAEAAIQAQIDIFNAEMNAYQDAKDQNP